MCHTAQISRKYHYMSLYVICDASASGIGGAFYQRDVDTGVLHPIAFAVCSLSIHERNYVITKLEQQTVIYFVNYFDTYLCAWITIL